MKNLLLVFSVYHIVVVTQTLNLKFLLGDNFLISFQFDTFFFRIVQFSRYNRSWEGAAVLRSMVGLARLELATSRLSGVRSNHLSYRPKLP